jgi:flagellar protein FlgJ
MIEGIRTTQISQGVFKKPSPDKIDPPGNGSAQDSAKTRLKTAVTEFEALFIYQLLKEMRQSTPGDFLGKGLGHDIYNSLFDMEVARLIAGRGLGLGEMILRQMNGRNRKGEIPASPPSNNPLLSKL